LSVTERNEVYELFNTALKNVNVMDVIQELVCINFLLEQLLMFRSGKMIIIGIQCYILLYYRKFEFQSGHTTKTRSSAIAGRLCDTKACQG